VEPTWRAARSASETPGRSTSIWLLPAWLSVASETPNAFTRSCIRSIERWIESASTVFCAAVGSAL
jgi:hypothetical protein